MESNGLKTTDIMRHYDVNSTPCPNYFVDNQEQWSKFLQDVQKAVDEVKKSK